MFDVVIVLEEKLYLNVSMLVYSSFLILVGGMGENAEPQLHLKLCKARLASKLFSFLVKSANLDNLAC